MKVQAGSPRSPSSLADPRPAHGPPSPPSFLSSASLGGEGVYVGYETAGGSFAYDPWVMTGRDLLSAPNILVTGEAGQGKTSLVITYLWRQQVFGRDAWVVDTTGAYAPLAEASKREPIRLETHGPLRLNPLDAGLGPDVLGPDEIAGRRFRALTSLATTVLRRSLTPQEIRACEIALGTSVERHGDPMTLPQVTEALLQPSAAGVREMGPQAQTLSMSSRYLALALRSAIRDHLDGLFDGPTTGGLAPQGPVTVVDLSAVTGSRSVPVLMRAAATWLRAFVTPAEPLILVLDDASALLATSGGGLLPDPGSPQPAASTVVVGRMPEPPCAPTDPDTSDRPMRPAPPRDLVPTFPTRVLYRVSSGAVPEATRSLDVSEDEADLLPRLPPGEALWKVGTRSFVVAHRVGGHERSLLERTQGKST